MSFICWLYCCFLLGDKHFNLQKMPPWYPPKTIQQNSLRLKLVRSSFSELFGLRKRAKLLINHDKFCWVMLCFMARLTDCTYACLFVRLLSGRHVHIQPIRHSIRWHLTSFHWILWSGRHWLGSWWVLFMKRSFYPVSLKLKGRFAYPAFCKGGSTSSQV